MREASKFALVLGLLVLCPSCGGGPTMPLTPAEACDAAIDSAIACRRYTVGASFGGTTEAEDRARCTTMNEARSAECQRLWSDLAICASSSCTVTCMDEIIRFSECFRMGP